MPAFIDYHSRLLSFFRANLGTAFVDRAVIHFGGHLKMS
jgi:hypothetical protein